MEANDVAVKIAGVNDIPRIASAYAAWGYGGGIEQHDTAWVAEMSGVLVGVVRVAPEHGALVLRGMQIAERWRGAGIGTRLLHAVALWLDDRTCFCIPYVRLKRFYAQIGFHEIPVSAAPPFLAARITSYRQKGLDVLMMVRSAGWS
jgi:GNAT superfamily N-acetyltransferase